MKKTRRVRLAPLLGLLMAACAHSSAFNAGERAERIQDYDRAVLEYSKAIQESPDDVQARHGLERARLRASERHRNEARRLEARGLYKEAIDAYALAMSLVPSASLAEEIGRAEARQRAGVQAASLDEVKDKAKERSLPGCSRTEGHRQEEGEGGPSSSSGPRRGRRA
jgi:tetratricopeptide (TPR) repeat protein